MAFIKYKGKTKTVWLPVTASTVMTKGDILSWSSGLLIRATSSTTALSHVGIAKKTILATDTDYATSARLIPVEVPMQKNVIWLADVTTTLVVGDIGAEVDLTDAQTVNRGASSVDAVIIAGFISATKGLVTINFYAGKQ
jgi:hypothetical protein